ncbi:DUF819 family protein [Mariniblastus fucicola]|nr:DUF819 family protein [Mariniblastus fucicola]
MKNLFLNLTFLPQSAWFLAPLIALAVTMPAIGQDASPESEPTVAKESSSESDVEEDAEQEAEPFAAEIGLLKDSFPDDSDSELVKELTKTLKQHKSKALITNDAIIFGILMVILGLIFWTSNSNIGLFKLFYKVVPMLLVCYFLPSLLTFFELVDHHNSNLYYMATRYLLPATLVLLTLSIDLKEIFKLGPKALIMFLTGTAGVVFGGPIAVLIVSFFAPDIIGVDGPEAVWRGLSTVAGSWIGGGANQAAMQVVFMSPPDGATAATEKNLGDLYSVMIAVDVFVAEIWMLFLLLGVGKADAIDRLFKADSSSIRRLQEKMEKFSQKVARVPSATDLMVLGAIGFGATALAHYGGSEISTYVKELIKATTPQDVGSVEAGVSATSPWAFLKSLGLASSFFWLIVISTTIGILLSFTPLKNYEGAGASKLGTVFIFILVAVIGMGMDISAVAKHPGYFLVGGIWMLFHVGLMFLVGWLIRAPYFFLAVGSKANIGGAASAPVVAAAFHPSLAPVGVLLAVLGYALGTYGAMVCAWMMQAATPAGG